MQKKLCVIVGVGPGNGAAFSKRFSEAHYRLALLARSTDFTKQLAKELQDAHAYACDVTNEASVRETFCQISRELGEIDVLIYNAGSGVWGNIEEITREAFQSSLNVNALGLMLTSQQVIPAMKKKSAGKIIVIGATASKRGGVSTAAFAPAKAAQRSLAESMAKYLGPYHIHVALVMIDGIVNLPSTRERMPDKLDSFFVEPDDVAQTVFWLTEQPSSAWTFEVEVRPFDEKWS